MKQQSQTSPFAALLLALFLLTSACTTTTAIRPDQLPRVTEWAAWVELNRHRPPPLSVLDAWGNPTVLENHLQRVTIEHRDRFTTDTFRAPVSSQIVGNTLIVSADIPRSYTPGDINRVEVTTSDPASVYRVSGIASIAVGSTLSGLGLTTLVLFGAGGRSVSGIVVPTALSLAGLPGLIIGPVLLSKAKKARLHPNRAMPELILSPTGAGLRGTF